MHETPCFDFNRSSSGLGGKSVNLAKEVFVWQKKLQFGLKNFVVGQMTLWFGLKNHQFWWKELKLGWQKPQFDR